MSEILFRPGFRAWIMTSLLPAGVCLAQFWAPGQASVYPGRWHGNDRCFGLHYDLHAGEGDTELGLRADPGELAAMLGRLGADFVQTDCKGHPGYTSWFSRTPEASVPPALKADAMAGWREATRRLGLPLHCHYSGIWDIAAAKKHPEWAVVDKDGKPTDRMCPRGPYCDKLMIPQMIELIDRYQVDGFWVDGDIWAVQPCYCELCRKAFAEETGGKELPRSANEPGWIPFMQFTRAGYMRYVTRYAEAVHQHKDGVLVCSNWLQTFRNPGPPAVPTDWISGDNTPTFGLDSGRCEARFISTRGKPWDIMIWSFYGEIPRTAKPPQMVQQEAAVVMALGGNVQVYEHPPGLRDGRLIGWRVDRLRKTRDFVTARQELCRQTEAIPQVAILHSEHHLYNHSHSDLFSSLDYQPVMGATFAMLENHYGVEVLDEWALLPRLSQFALVVAPERHLMSDGMVEALKTYVHAGGRLMLSGADSFDRFGPDFIGAGGGKVTGNATYWIPAEDGTVPAVSPSWRLLDPGPAETLCRLGQSGLPDDRLLSNPGAVLHSVGQGQVAYIPFSVFRFFSDRRFPMTRAFVGQIARRMTGRLPVHVDAPTAVDVVLRRKDGKTVVHLINRLSGIPNNQTDGTVDEIPAIGPVVIEIAAAARPREVTLAFEPGPLTWDHADQKVTIRVPVVQLHAAVVVDPG